MKNEPDTLKDCILRYETRVINAFVWHEYGHEYQTKQIVCSPILVFPDGSEHCITMFYGWHLSSKYGPISQAVGKVEGKKEDNRWEIYEDGKLVETHLEGCPHAQRHGKIKRRTPLDRFFDELRALEVRRDEKKG